jgi:hypothetical protein
MEMEVGARTGASLGQKSPDRLVQRNGYRDRAPGRSSRKCDDPNERRMVRITDPSPEDDLLWPFTWKPESAQGTAPELTNWSESGQATSVANAGQAPEVPETSASTRARH